MEIDSTFWGNRFLEADNIFQKLVKFVTFDLGVRLTRRLVCWKAKNIFYNMIIILIKIDELFLGWRLIPWVSVSDELWSIRWWLNIVTLCERYLDELYIVCEWCMDKFHIVLHYYYYDDDDDVGSYWLYVKGLCPIIA